jgi:hypothetical protein
LGHSGVLRGRKMLKLADNPLDRRRPSRETGLDGGGGSLLRTRLLIPRDQGKIQGNSPYS